MSVQLMQQYYAKVEQITRYGGARDESSLRKPIQDLLEQYARSKNLVLMADVEYITKAGRRVVPDGTLKDALRQERRNSIRIGSRSIRNRLLIYFAVYVLCQLRP